MPTGVVVLGRYIGRLLRLSHEQSSPEHGIEGVQWVCSVLASGGTCSAWLRVVAATQAMSNDLRSRNIAVAALHPGYVRTDMSPAGAITAEESVTGLLQRVVELNMENSGGFWHTNGEKLAW